jgi:hypothetical protein
LDQLLSSITIPSNFLLSIDIDGNDYYAWKAVKIYRPKIVIIEFNPTIPDPVEFIQPCNAKINQGSSLLALCKLAEEKSYHLISTTFTNAFFVDSKFL